MLQFQRSQASPRHPSASSRPFSAPYSFPDRPQYPNFSQTNYLPEHGLYGKESRSVYVLARPINAAGVFSFLSHGKFPLCHWGILVSRFKSLPSEVQAAAGLETNPYSSSSSNLCDRLWGTLFELFRDPVTNENRAHMIEGFGHREITTEWHLVAMSRIGETQYLDPDIYCKG